MIVLDTHAWVWNADDPGRLSGPARDAIASADRILVSAISAWEVATLAERGRLDLGRPVEQWISQSLAGPGLAECPVSTVIAIKAARLDRAAFPGDPADRIIYATARQLGAALITRDGRMREFDPRHTIW